MKTNVTALDKGVRHCLKVTIVGLFLGFPTLAAAGWTTPSASTGDYTVSSSFGCPVSGNVTCYAVLLQERTLPNGQWAVVGNNATKHFTNKPLGQYEYRVGVAYCTYYTGPYPTCTTVFSSTAMVTVVDHVPARDTLPTQRAYTYEARVGDLYSDGQPDIWIKRTSGGEAFNGNIGGVILHKLPDGSFSSFVPSQADATTASGWPHANGIQLVQEDFNVDGYVDIELKNIASGIGGGAVPDQIVYAPGAPLQASPLGIKSVDASLKQFVANSLDYFFDPSYYVDNAPIVIFAMAIPHFACGSYANQPFISDAQGILEPSYAWGPSFGSCTISYSYVSGAYKDFSVFSSNALDVMWYEWCNTLNYCTDDESTSAAKQATEEVFGASVGGWPAEEVIGADGELTTDPFMRRGLEGFWAILRISQKNDVPVTEAPPQNTAWYPIEIRARHVIGVPVPALHSELFYHSESHSEAIWADNSGTPLHWENLVAHIATHGTHPSLFMVKGWVIWEASGATSKQQYWQQLISATHHYQSMPAPRYNAWPAFFNGAPGYNCNGFTESLVNATGGYGLPPLSSYMWAFNGRSVPANYFIQ